MNNIIEYLNTDLVIASESDLTTLVCACQARGVFPLYLTHAEDGLWHATIETQEQYDEPEKSISVMLSAIESLSESDKLTWASCSKREFNIGYDCGDDPWAFNQALSSDLLCRIAAAGGELRITLYPDRPPK